MPRVQPRHARVPGLQAEAARRMEDAIGCQIGCQDGGTAPPDVIESAVLLGKEVTLTFASWNRVVEWLRQLEAIRAAA